MEISLNSLNDTIKLTSDDIQQVLLDRSFSQISFSFESCVDSSLTAQCNNGQVSINETADFTVQIPKVNNLFIQSLEAYSIFADKSVNLTPTPIYYDSDHGIFVRALQNQIINTFSALGASTDDILLEYTDGTSFLNLTLKNLPLGWIGRNVKYNIDGHVKTDTFTHSITENLFASNHAIYIKSSLLGLTNFIDDVLKIKITINLTNGACMIMTGCFFIDASVGCNLASDISELQEGQLERFLIHYGLQTASGCVTDCTDMCSLLQTLTSSVNNGC